jgi:hypothetical protein
VALEASLQYSIEYRERLKNAEMIKQEKMALH